MRKKKILFVCSSGGHFLQLYSLSKPLCEHYDAVWVSFDKPDTRSMLKDQRKYWGYFPTNRNIPNLLKNTALALRILREERPDCVMSTGAGISVPFLLCARFFGARAVYVESFARKTNISLTGRLVYWFVDNFFVQSKILENQYKRAVYRGTIY